MAKRVTVIDIGSNSIRMVVYEKTSRFSFHLLHEAKSKVRISENAYEYSGNLQEIPMQRAFDALSDFLNISKSLKARKVLCVATSALRDAPNRKDFILKVREQLKLNIKIIDGQKEAYLGAIACANLLPQQTNAISIDIGGGSTEFTIINGKNVEKTLSLELGTVRLKELFFDKKNLDDAKKYIDTKLEALQGFTPTTIIGIGGTFRALSAAIMEKKSYPFKKLHAFEYKIDELKFCISEILNADESTLKKLGIKSNRLDVIKPGALILQRVMHRLNLEKVVTSGVGVREGVYLADLLRHSKDRLPNNYNTSVRNIIDCYIDDTNFSNQLSKLSKKLFDLTYNYLNLDVKYRTELALASKLYPAGANIHLYSQNKYSYSIIQSNLEYGFTHSQTLLISTLNKYAKKKLPSASHKEKYSELLPNSSSLDALSYLISLSIALLSHKPRNIDFDLEFNEGILKVISRRALYLSKDAVEKLECDKGLKVIF